MPSACSYSLVQPTLRQFLFIMVALVAFGIGTGLAIVYYRKAADAATQGPCTA